MVVVDVEVTVLLNASADDADDDDDEEEDFFVVVVTFVVLVGFVDVVVDVDDRGKGQSLSFTVRIPMSMQSSTPQTLDGAAWRETVVMFRDPMKSEIVFSSGPSTQNSPCDIDQRASHGAGLVRKQDVHDVLSGCDSTKETRVDGNALMISFTYKGICRHR